MKTLQILTAIAALVSSSSAIAWWGPFDNNNDRYGYRGDNNRWDNRWGNNAFGDMMSDVMGDMSGDMDVEIKFKIRGKGRGNGNTDGYWNNDHRYNNYNGYGYAPNGNQTYYRNTPAYGYSPYYGYRL